MNKVRGWVHFYTSLNCSGAVWARPRADIIVVDTCLMGADIVVVPYGQGPGLIL